MKTKLRHLLSLVGTVMLVFLMIGAIAFGASRVTSSNPPPATGAAAPAAGGGAYKSALTNALKARGYEGFEPAAAVEGGKFKVEATGTIGRCTVVFKWIVGVLSAAQQVAPAAPSGTVVRFKLDKVMQASDGKMVAYPLTTANPSPDDTRQHLMKPGSPCSP